MADQRFKEEEVEEELTLLEDTLPPMEALIVAVSKKKK